jgi:hypothetical protein
MGTITGCAWGAGVGVSTICFPSTNRGMEWRASWAVAETASEAAMLAMIKMRME